MKAPKPVTLCCEHLGTAQHPQPRRNKRYCSNKCRQRAYRDRRRVALSPVLSVVHGNNADLIKEVAKLYATRPDVTIADVTYGKGAFWRKTPELLVTGSDIETVSERPYDLRALPYDDRSFDIVVLDPPYLHNPGRHVTDHRFNNAATTAGSDYDDILQLYHDGLKEASRVAREYVWVKCKDQVSSKRQRWMHLDIARLAEELALVPVDLFHLYPASLTSHRRWQTQQHARKVLSHFWVFGV